MHPCRSQAGAGWPEYLALNVGGKVPTLVEGEFVLTESGAICTYIGDRFPATGLTPPVGGQERARYDQWCYFALSELEQPLWTIGKHTFALPERRRAPAVLETARWEFSVAAKILAEGLGRREFIAGDRVSPPPTFWSRTRWPGHRLSNCHWGTIIWESYTTRLLARPVWRRARNGSRPRPGRITRLGAARPATRDPIRRWCDPVSFCRRSAPRRRDSWPAVPRPSRREPPGPQHNRACSRYSG